MSQSQGRNIIINNIRKSLGRGELPAETVKSLCMKKEFPLNPPSEDVTKKVTKKLKRSSLWRGRGDFLFDRFADQSVSTLGHSLVYKFTKHLEKVAGSFELIPNVKDIPFAILDFLQMHNLPQKMVVDSRLEVLPWPNKLCLFYRAAGADDVVSVSSAFAGIAETGSLVLLSSPAAPTTLNFLPDNHIVVLHKDHLVALMEDVWARLRSQPIPRSVNIITGPSRTADIEQTIQLGAHGPRRLHVLLVDKLGL